MALIVQKYGGSSVADAARIQSVARRAAESAPGNQLVVVVSAWTHYNLVRRPVAGASLAKRGPPSSLRLSPN